MIVSKTFVIEPFGTSSINGNSWTVGAPAPAAGMPVSWHNRLQLPLGKRQAPLAEHDSLEPLLTLAIERDLHHR